MPRLPALVDVLTQIDDRGRNTVDLIARFVREAGYLPTTKRGRGASEVTTEHAATLLLALCLTGPLAKLPNNLRALLAFRQPVRPRFDLVGEVPPEIMLTVSRIEMSNNPLGITTALIETSRYLEAATLLYPHDATDFGFNVEEPQSALFVSIRWRGEGGALTYSTSFRPTVAPWESAPRYTSVGLTLQAFGLVRDLLR